MSFAGTALVRVARAELQRRLDTFPARIAKHPDQAEPRVVNFQAWTAIADWLEHGHTRHVHYYGGAGDSTWIDWRTLDEAAAKELKALEKKLEQATGSPGEQDEAGQASEARAELQRRRDCIFCIATAVHNRRAFFDRLNGELRARADVDRQAKAAA